MAVMAAALTAHGAMAAPEGRSWTDDSLMAAYKELRTSGMLDAAIRNPTRPHEPPQDAFLQALAWFAAGTPNASGVLTLAELDRFIDGQAAFYRDLLTAKMEKGASNDYSRTRTWKVIQKMMLLRDEMMRAPHNGKYAFTALTKATSAIDPWEQAHTLRSPEEFVEKVCKVADRPVLVKYGNTNCTQCMLFELTGSIKSYADVAASRGPIDVYKVWFGMQPDGTFAGRIRDPKRLNDLAKAEGVSSSPTFIVYRNGRRYPCGDAFPDASGNEAKLDTCIAKATGDAPVASACTGAKP
ncbi:MAG TPA: thioredoxin family protein [Vicinamibacterales bacterium]|nr:thioredoxin family protein [Vicinamibacterales bacterium]